ncbi:hypothetical protein [Haladaptatus cibarius]|uniref:hypothetical protein n=1 Tax=Haladaptatus cibarius TaxID=453847 RepID=UPI000678A5FD|nr:hypothetical protein [Haladaptatus cibarius]
MLFNVVAGLVVLGLAVWLIGQLLRYKGVAMIGAAIIIIAGSAIALTGVEIRTGETRSYSYSEFNGTAVRDNATVSYDYQTRTLAQILNIGVLGSLGLGGLVMLLGAVLMSQTLAEDL